MTNGTRRTLTGVPANVCVSWLDPKNFDTPKSPSFAYPINGENQTLYYDTKYGNKTSVVPLSPELPFDVKKIFFDLMSRWMMFLL